MTPGRGMPARRSDTLKNVLNLIIQVWEFNCSLPRWGDLKKNIRRPEWKSQRGPSFCPEAFTPGSFVPLGCPFVAICVEVPWV